MNQPSRIASLLAGTALALMAVPGMADSMRCGNLLVVNGDTTGKLSSRCGKPAAISRTSILRGPPAVWFHGRLVQTGFGAVEVPVETWEYNFGPNRLIHRVRIEDGLVVAIDTLGYGYP